MEEDIHQVQYDSLNEKIDDIKIMVTNLHETIYKNGFIESMSKLQTNQQWHWRVISGVGVIVAGLLLHVLKKAYF